MQVLGAHELFIVENIHHNPELRWDDKCSSDYACLIGSYSSCHVGSFQGKFLAMFVPGS